jgi:hypothetical protein
MLSAALAASAITAILFMEFLPNYSADFVRQYARPNEREKNERERSAELRIKFWTDCGWKGTA